MVERGRLDLVVEGILNKERSLVEELNKILPHVSEESIKSGLERRLQQSLEHIGALESGFVPLDGGWFIDIKSKSKWDKGNIKAVLETMPEEVQEAWRRVEQLGVFKGFSISGARRSGDPMLVGRAGRKYFLIAAWVNFEGGYSAGFRVLGKS